MAKLDKNLVEDIRRNMIDKGLDLEWEDVCGLTDVKKALNETIVQPAMRPDLF